MVYADIFAFVLSVRPWMWLMMEYEKKYFARRQSCFSNRHAALIDAGQRELDAGPLALDADAGPRALDADAGSRALDACAWPCALNAGQRMPGSVDADAGPLLLDAGPRMGRARWMPIPGRGCWAARA